MVHGADGREVDGVANVLRRPVCGARVGEGAGEVPGGIRAGLDDPVPSLASLGPEDDQDLLVGVVQPGPAVGLQPAADGDFPAVVDCPRVTCTAMILVTYFHCKSGALATALLSGVAPR